MTKWARMSDFSITLPNRPGELARLAAKLRAADINLVGLWGYGGNGGDGGDGGAAKFYCVPKSADQFLEFVQSADLEVKEGTTFYFSGADHAGALVKQLESIASAGINLRAIQSVAFNSEFGCFVWAEPEDWEKLTRLMA